MSLADITPYPSPTGPDQMTLPEKDILLACSVLLRRCNQLMQEYDSVTADRFAKRLTLASEAVNRRHGGFQSLDETRDAIGHLCASHSPDPGDVEWEALGVLRAVLLLLEAAA